MLNSELLTTLEAIKLRDDKYTFLFDSPNTNSDFLFSNPKAFKTLMKFLVLGASNSKFVEKGDYVRVQNIVLGYRVPATALQSVFKDAVKSVRVFAQVQNPFVFTSYSGLDPEVVSSVPGTGESPRGIDFFSYPRSRSFILGASINF